MKDSSHGLSLNDVAGYSPEDEVEFIIKDSRREFLLKQAFTEYSEKIKFLKSGLPEIPSNILTFVVDY